MRENEVMSVARVVIVDDNADFCHLMGRLIRHLGYDATCLTSGVQLMQHLTDQMPELVILDLMMPDMDGLDVLSAIRKDDKLQELPVVIFSALSDQKLQRKAAAMGATEWWLKAGVDFTSIAQRLGQYLGSPDVMINHGGTRGALMHDDTTDPHSG